MAKRISGTREWSVASLNCSSGCSNGCRYCYKRDETCHRFKRRTEEEWTKEVVNQTVVKAGHKKVYGGTVMFPTGHDITPVTIEACLTVLKKVLKAGNKVLITSKPRLEMVKRLCEELKEFRSQVLFRFTITARKNEILAYWEPGAPTYEERKLALKYAFEDGWGTSVSMEPMLDTGDAVPQFYDLCPYVSDTIWLGKMNKPKQRVRPQGTEAEKKLQWILDGQDDATIKALYETLRSEPKVRWKESVKEVVGLPLATEAGTDQ